MEGTSAAEAAHHCCHCIAAPKALRHPKARKCSPPPNLKLGARLTANLSRQKTVEHPSTRFLKKQDFPNPTLAPNGSAFGWRSGSPLRFRRC
jgi:hypothetical protein